MAEAVEEPVLQHLARLLVQLRLVTGALEDVADELVEGAAVRAGLHFGGRAVECFLHEPVPLLHFAGRLTDDVRARHVGVAAGLLVLREQVENDGLVSVDLARAHVVADGGLRPMGDDHAARFDIVVGEDVLDRALEPLARQRLAVDLEPAVLARAAQELARGVEPGLARLLCAADPGQLGLALGTPPPVEHLPVDGELELVAAQEIGETQGEAGGHHGLRDSELAAAAQDELLVDLPSRQGRREEVVRAELLVRDNLEIGLRPEPRDLERVDHDRAPIAALDVQELVRNHHRNLVAKLGGPDRVAPDEHVGHARILPAGQWGT